MQTIQYKQVFGVDPNLLSLDYYGSPGQPVMCFIHGGSWRNGDKSAVTTAKKRFASRLGMNLVSINYRLVPGVMYPVFNEDAADAIRWISGNLSTEVILMGHSAGGCIAASLACDQGYLESSWPNIKGTISLDIYYDVQDRVRRGVNIYEDAFGNDLSVAFDASPLNHVEPGIAPFLIVTRGDSVRVADANAFHNKLLANQVQSTLIHAAGYTHAEVNSAVGRDDLITPAIEQFIAGIL